MCPSTTYTITRQQLNQHRHTYIFVLCVDAIEVHVHLWKKVLVVLFHNARRLLLEHLRGSVVPPVLKLALAVKLFAKAIAKVGCTKNYSQLDK